MICKCGNMCVKHFIARNVLWRGSAGLQTGCPGGVHAARDRSGKQSAGLEAQNGSRDILIWCNISHADLKTLVKEFSKPRPEFDSKSYVTRRRDWFDKPMENIRPLQLQNALTRLTEQDALKIYREMSVGAPLQRLRSSGQTEY
jgi:hypothetical protein